MNLNKNIAVSDSGFIFHATTADSFTTNHTGMEIIRLLQNGKSREEIIQELSKNYSIELLQAEKDLVDFLSLLETYQMLQKHV